jgi:transcriptional regulator with XRE-family HTH domain
VKQIEGGKNVGRVETLMSIARAFDVTVGELFVDPDEPMPEALERFLASPSAQDVTAEEKTYLLSARARDKQLTEATYYVLLQAWREMPDKKSVG